MRVYPGVDISVFTDTAQQMEVRKMDVFLRDISSSSGTQDANPDSPQPAIDDEPFVTIGNTSSLSKERALAASSPVVLTDGGANASATLSLDIATLEPLLDHGNLSGLATAADDDHPQYIRIVPTTDARNTITPTGTNDMALQCRGFVGFDSAEPTNLAQTRRGLMFPGDCHITGDVTDKSIWLDTNADLAANPIAIVDTNRLSSRVKIFSTSGAWHASNDVMQVLIRSNQTGKPTANEILLTKLEVGNDGRGHFVIGHDQNRNNVNPAEDSQFGIDARVSIYADYNGAQGIHGLWVSGNTGSYASAGVRSIPLIVQRAGGTQDFGYIAWFIDDHLTSDPGILMASDRVDPDPLASATATDDYPVIVATTGEAISTGIPREDLIIRPKHYIWCDADDDTQAVGGYRFDQHYIMGVDETDSNKLKVWTIGADGLTNAEHVVMSPASVGATGFLETDSTGIDSGLAYTFTNAAPITLSGNTTTTINWGTGAASNQFLNFDCNVGGTSSAIVNFHRNATARMQVQAGSTIVRFDGFASSGMFFSNLSGGGTLEFVTTGGGGNTEHIILNPAALSEIQLKNDTHLDDNIKHVYGTGDDAEIYYDATDLVIDPGPSDNLKFGAGAGGTDPTITFNGTTNDGTIKWDESASAFEWSGPGPGGSNEFRWFGPAGSGSFKVNQTTSGSTNTASGTLSFAAGGTIQFNNTSGTITLSPFDKIVNLGGTTLAFVDASSSITTLNNTLTIDTGTAAIGTVHTGSGASITYSFNNTDVTFGADVDLIVTNIAGFNRLTTDASFQIETTGTAGDENHLTFDVHAGDAAGKPTKIIFNDDSRADVDIVMEGETLDPVFYLDGSADAIGIGHASPTSQLDVNLDVRCRQVIADGDNAGVASTNSLTNGAPALGGGAPPTFGTIGGTGPATAAQAAWMKVYIGTTAAYVPYWT